MEVKPNGHVLYELTEVFKQVTQIRKDPLRALRLKTFPETVSAHVERSCPWKIAVHEQSKLLAVLLQNGDIEVQDFTGQDLELVGRTKVASDGNVEWSHLEWSDSGTLLLFVRCTPIIDVMDIAGNPCYSIPLENTFDVSFDPYECVSQIQIQTNVSGKWCDKLFVLQYSGSISCYDIGLLSGFHPIFRTDLEPCVERGLATAFVLLPHVNLLIVSALYKPYTLNPESITSSNIGVRSFRVLDAKPFFIPVPLSNAQEAIEALQKSTIFSRFLDAIPFCASERACIASMSVNKDLSKLACLSTTGDLVVFYCPSLRPAHIFIADKSHPQQLFVSVGWWSNEELILHRSNGCVYIVTCDEHLESNLRPQAPPSHAFLPWSQTVAASKGLAFVLETSIKDEQIDENEGKVLLVFKMSLIAAYGWIKLMLGWAVGQPLHEVNRPSPEALAKRKIEIKLNELRGFTPEEMFRKKLLAQEFGEALDLAKAYHIDSDIVYRQQWRSSPITKHTIRDYLRKVKNTNWVLNECLERVPETDEICYQLINLGLDLSDISAVDPISINVTQRSVCEIRVKLLHYMTVLNVYQAIQRKTGGAFESTVYRKLRSFSLLDMALYLARTGQCDALLIVLKRHKHVLYEHWLCIISNIPEVVSVEEFKQLLPRVNNGSIESWAAEEPRIDLDPVETPEFRLALANIFLSCTTQSNVYDVTPSLNNFRLIDGSDHMRIFIDWFRIRALQLQEETSLPSLTYRFLHQAVLLGFADLHDLEQDANAYVNYVNVTGDVTLTLDQFQNGNPADLLNRIVHQNLGSDALTTIESKALPYLKHCEAFGRCIAKDTLFSFIQSQSVHSLQLVSKIINSSSKRGFLSQGKTWSVVSLDLNVSDAIHLIESCLLFCECVGDKLIIPATQLLNYIQNAEDEPGFEIIEKLHNYLKALSILDYYGVNCTLAHLHNCSKEKTMSEAILVQCMRKAISGKGNVAASKEWNVIEWQRLNKDLLQVVHSSLHLLDSNTCQKMFVSGLLSSGDHTIIAYASQFCNTHPKSRGSKDGLSYDLTVALVLSSSRDYIQAAERASDPLISLARACLELVQDPKPPAINEDLDMIAALPVLEELGLHELPVRICIAEDRMQFVEKALSSSKENYKEAKRLLKVSDFLCSDKGKTGEKERHGRILTRCARQALECDDFTQAAKYCRLLKSQSYWTSWDICRDVVLKTLHTRSFDVHTSIDLLSFAILHCNAEELPNLMSHLKKLKENALMAELGEAVGGSNEEGDVENILKKHMVASAGMVRFGLDKFRTYSNKLITAHDQQTKDKPIILVPKIDPIYVSLNNLQDIQMSSDLDDLSDEVANLATELRLLLLADAKEVEDKELIDVLAALSQNLLRESLSWTVAVFLTLSSSLESIEKATQSYESNDVMIEMLLYYYSLLVLGQITPENRRKLLKFSPKSLIDLVWKYVNSLPKTESLTKYLYWANICDQMKQKGLLSLVSKDINVARFTQEDDYRRDTIIGMALSVKEESYQAALDLASQHNIPQFDVVFAHLEYILTESGLPINEMQALIKSRRMVSTLSKHPDRLLLESTQKILPLLEANNGSLLLLYFLLLEKGCNGLPEATQAQTHRSVLRHIMKLAPGLDYRLIMDKNNDLYKILHDHLTARNVENMAKVLPKQLTRDVTPAQVMSIWAAKIFEERLHETGVSSSCKAAFTALGCIKADEFHYFVNHIVNNKDHFKICSKDLKLFLEACLHHIQSFSDNESACSFINDLLAKYEEIENVGDKCKEDRIDTDVVVAEERIVVDELDVHQLAKAARDIISEARTHPVLKTHKAAMYLLRNHK